MNNPLINMGIYTTHKVKVAKARQPVLAKNELKYKCSEDNNVTPVNAINLKCQVDGECSSAPLSELTLAVKLMFNSLKSEIVFTRKSQPIIQDVVYWRGFYWIIGYLHVGFTVYWILNDCFRIFP